MKIPQGLTKAQFNDVAALLRSEAGHIGDDILVHGSRAEARASAESDIDFAIRVSHEKFDAMIKSRFGSPDPDSAKFRTMQHAVATGKIQAGEAGLRILRRELQRRLGMKGDLSVIKTGGPFDQGPYIPIP